MADQYDTLKELMRRSRRTQDRVRVAASPETIADLRSLGIGLPSSVQQRQPGPGDILVCMLVTTPLMLPDNIVGKCSECGAGVQYRSHTGEAAKKGAILCCAPCALRRARGDA